MPSLTRAEAADRAALLRVHSYAIALDVTGRAGFSSTSRILFSCTAPGSATFVEISAATVVEVVLNGVRLDPAALVDNRLPLPELLAENDLLVRADAPYSHSGDGLHHFVDPEDGETYVYGEAPLDHAQRMFACFDQPDLKAPLTLTVTAGPQWIVRANAPGQKVGGKWVFEPTPPLSTYLFTVLAGPYHLIEQTHDGIPLGLLCRRSLARDLDREAGELFAATAANFDRYHELFDVRYPFVKYDQAFVPEFHGGAVENPGMVNFREEFLFRGADARGADARGADGRRADGRGADARASASDAERERRSVVMAHEMAHMWFGDLVTLRWWDDIWLNEAFAEYMGWRVAAETGRYPSALAGFTAWRKRWGYLADQRPSTHPVAPVDVADTAMALLNFDGISYAKGASALRQLATLLGDDAFLTGVRAYFAAHRFANATLADLIAALTEASGVDLAGWTELWLRTAGTNTLRLTVTRAADGTVQRVVVEQTGLPLRPHRLAIGAYGPGAGGRKVEVSISGERVDVDGFAGLPLGTVLLVNDGDLTYAKARFDAVSRAALPVVLPSIPDPLTRALVWMTAIDAVRDGEMPPDEFVVLVRAALSSEAETTVFEQVLQFARDSLARRGLVPFEPLATVCMQALERAAPGSGRQFAVARALVTCAGRPEAELLAGWLTGQGVPDGLDIGADLRWSLLQRLTVLEVAGEPDIAAESIRDPSARGIESAARCRAGLATFAAKARAWDLIVNDERPRIATASAEGFWQLGQERLTDPYVARYFAEMPALIDRRTQLAAQAVVRQAFPQYSRKALQPADLLLARTGLDPTLRREVGDAADELRKWV